MSNLQLPQFFYCDYCRCADGLGQHHNETEVALLVDENEKMSNSLLSLTSHFAQVQFRLKQIVEGPEDCKMVSFKN